MPCHQGEAAEALDSNTFLGPAGRRRAGGASDAIAAGPTGQSAGQYQSERAGCNNTLQTRSACIREAGAAQRAARQGALTSAPTDVYRSNALARCRVQPTRKTAQPVKTACWVPG